eukprot:SAG31_NODE_4348_length_3325_cov_1.733416_4_plen_37_part_00
MVLEVAKESGRMFGRDGRQVCATHQKAARIEYRVSG